MTLSTVGILAKPRSHNDALRNKRRETPMFALLRQQRSNPSHSPRPRIRGTLSHTAECAVDEKSKYSGTVSLSTHQYRPSFRSSIICSARALGLINSIKLTVSTGDPVASASKTIEHGRVRHATDCLIAGLEDCLNCESLQTLLCLELPPVRCGTS